jgi:hypothetical protein
MRAFSFHHTRYSRWRDIVFPRNLRLRFSRTNFGLYRLYFIPCEDSLPAFSASESSAFSSGITRIVTSRAWKYVRRIAAWPIITSMQSKRFVSRHRTILVFISDYMRWSSFVINPNDAIPILVNCPGVWPALIRLASLDFREKPFNRTWLHAFHFNSFLQDDKLKCLISSACNGPPPFLFEPWRESVALV